MPAAKGSARTPLGPIPKIVATYVYASSQGQRTHSARTNIFYSVWLRKLSIEEEKFKVFCRGWGSDVISIFSYLAMTFMIFNLLFQKITTPDLNGIQVEIQIT